MINPILIIITIALLLSVLVVCILNKPKKPIVTGTLIFLLACFVTITFMIDNVISNLSRESIFLDIVNFVIMTDEPTYVQLSSSFNTFMMIDIALFILSFVSLIIEALNILKSDKRI